MNRFVFTIITILTLLQTGLYSQESTKALTDTSEARNLFDKALNFHNSARYDSAIVLYDSAATLYADANIIGLRIRCLSGKAACFRLKGNYDKALEALRVGKSVEDVLLKEDPSTASQRLVTLGSIYRQQGRYDTTLVLARSALSIQHTYASNDTILQSDIYSVFAGAYFDMGEHDSALAFNHRVIELFPFPETPEQQSKVGSSFNAIAIIYESRGDYRKALEYFTRSLDIHLTLRGEKHPDIARLYGNAATAYFRLGDYDMALEYHLKSLGILNETLESDHPSFGVGYNNIAMVYRSKGVFDKALEYGEKSKTIFVKRLGAKHANVAGVINNIGRTYSDMKQYGHALESFQEALSVWKEKLGEKHPNVLQCYFNIGEAYGKLREFDKAKKWLEQSLKLRRETLGEKNVKTAQSFNGLGDIYADWKKTDSSLHYYQEAISALIEDFADTNVYANPAILKSPSDLDLLAALSGKAKAFHLQYSTKRKLNSLKASLDTYEHAAKLIENIRRSYSAEGSKIQLGQTAFTVYEHAIAGCQELFALTKDASYTSAAFSFAERSKAGILQDAISESHAKQFAGIPDTLLEQESKLRIDIAYNETQIQKEKEKKEKASKAKLEQFENTLFSQRRTYESLIEGLEKYYPEYYSLKHQSGIVALHDVQKKLPDSKTALLEYVVGDSTTTVFVITKKRGTIKLLKIPSSSLITLVKQFRRSIQNIEGEEHVTLGDKLYTQLIAPVKADLKGIRKLYIIPDGILHYLPFEALVAMKEPSPKSSGLAYVPYIIFEYEISYQVSARLLGESETLSRLKNSFLGIAPVFADKPAHSKTLFSTSVERVTRSRTIDGENFVELKESEEEVRNINALFETEKQPAKLFLHNQAKESVLKSPEIENYRFIHIATHGIINEEKPKLSGIIFAAPDKNSSDDGVLYSGEIYNLKLNADLVTLSACETGLGTIVKGEGILGLTRGFMYAGANNLLVSLWQVADKSTSELMTQFYRNILNGQSYSAALRNAKLMMIKGWKYSHPVEWSPFVLTGK